VCSTARQALTQPSARRVLLALQAELRAARERTGPTDPTTLRAEKIARFKADKQARAQQPRRASTEPEHEGLRCSVAVGVHALLTRATLRSCLRSLRRWRRALHAAALATVRPFLALPPPLRHTQVCAPDAPLLARPGEGEGEAVTDGEEEARAAWTLRARASVLRALDLGPSLATEAQLLAHRAAAGAAGAAGTLAPPRRDAPEQQQPGLARGVAAAAAALARSDVERLRAGVFRPSHILPTMTVEQFGASRARTFRVCAAVCREVQTANGMEGFVRTVCALD
jgi:hypothetical protein